MGNTSIRFGNDNIKSVEVRTLGLHMEQNFRWWTHKHVIIDSLFNHEEHYQSMQSN